jgi:hypothetical protein
MLNTNILNNRYSNTKTVIYYLKKLTSNGIDRIQPEVSFYISKQVYSNNGTD